MTERKSLVVGLTGQTGAGKTTVSEAFEKHGYAVINADQLARTVTSEPEVLLRLSELFGEEILLPDGSLDRKALGARVFSDPAELHRFPDRRRDPKINGKRAAVHFAGCADVI